jgi:hypothetical protein
MSPYLQASCLICITPHNRWRKETSGDVLGLMRGAFRTLPLYLTERVFSGLPEIALLSPMFSEFFPAYEPSAESGEILSNVVDRVA